VVDIGCSKGHWTTSFARQNPDKNVLGVDIRQPVVDMAMARKESLKLGNVHFLASNANVNISQILSSIEEQGCGGVELITIQFPDPYFKARQHKRRLVNEAFIGSIISGQVRAGTRIFIQTDVEDLMGAMVGVLERCAHLVAPAEGHSYSSTLLNPAPYDLPTEREESCRENGNFDIHRIMVRTITSTSSISLSSSS
jgi:tRNA (guanine-N7-)-methyltransferase